MNRLGVDDVAYDLTANSASPVAAHSHSSSSRPSLVSVPSEIIDASRRTDAPAKRHISDKNHELGNKKSRLGDDLSSAQHKIALVDDIKENIIIDDDNDAPIDLSLGNHHKTSTTSSNNDSWSATQATFDVSLVQQLRDELRNEETKLVLLRKLRNSQLSQQLIGSSTGNVQLPAAAASGHRPHTTTQSAVRGAAPVANGVAHSNGVSTHHAAVRADQLRTGYNRLTAQQNNGRPVAPPAALSRQSQQPATRQPFASSPATTRYQVPHHPVSSHHQSPAPQPPQPAPPRETPPRPVVPELTLAQRQAAAKLAVRRQLEATLLQLPLPKCPPPELNFVPGIGSHADFVALLGLEEAVQCIINSKPPEADASSNNGTESGTSTELVASTSKDAKDSVTTRKDPFQCARCQTDFTTIWKRDKDNPDAIVCEQCATAARKQALKQEHTDRLKAAFLHALQQERELEATGYTSVVIPPSAPVGTSSRSRVTAADVSYRGYEWKPMHYSASDSRLLQNAAMSLSVAAAANRARVDVRSQQPATSTQQIVRRS